MKSNAIDITAQIRPLLEKIERQEAEKIGKLKYQPVTFTREDIAELRRYYERKYNGTEKRPGFWRWLRVNVGGTFKIQKDDDLPNHN